MAFLSPLLFRLLRLFEKKKTNFHERFFCHGKLLHVMVYLKVKVHFADQMIKSPKANNSFLVLRSTWNWNRQYLHLRQSLLQLFDGCDGFIYLGENILLFNIGIGCKRIPTSRGTLHFIFRIVPVPESRKDCGSCLKRTMFAIKISLCIRSPMHDW